MTAAPKPARAALGRRRGQLVIGVVVLLCAATAVLALGLAQARSSGFEQSYRRQAGAHLVATFDPARVSPEQLARTAGASGVAAAAGPFGEAVLRVEPGSVARGTVAPTLTVVGRDDPGGPVDRLNLWRGRWAAGPGEVVLQAGLSDGDPVPLGSQISVPGGPDLKVVGLAATVSDSADAWVTSGQMAALHPAATQMLYRFAHAATGAELAAGQSAVTGAVPAGSLLATQSSVAVAAGDGGGLGALVPFLAVFSVLMLATAVLTIVTVMRGAVARGARRIGLLKVLGLGPGRVLAVYLAMACVPIVVATVAGAVLGAVLAEPVLSLAGADHATAAAAVTSWVVVAVLLGVPALMLPAAAVPAYRARRLATAEAGAVPAGDRVCARGPGIQRWLGGTRLPRSVSLGIATPLARPARSALALAAVLLGVLAMTLACGLVQSAAAYENAVNPSKAGLVMVMAGGPPGPVTAPGPGPGAALPQTTAATPALTDAQDEAMLRGLPGVRHVQAVTQYSVNVVGEAHSVPVSFLRGDAGRYDRTLTRGHRPDGPGQAAATGSFLRKRGLAIGDTITLEADGHRSAVRIVGDVLADTEALYSEPQTRAQLIPDARADVYQVELAPGSDEQAFTAAVAAADPGLTVAPSQGGHFGGAALAIGASLLFALIAAAVAGLGVCRAVALDVRERRRDLGLLKSIGMSSRQVTSMVVTSQGTLGVLGGLAGVALGFAVHRLVVSAVLHALQADATGAVVDVFPPALLVALVAAGALIAVLGALVPARRSSRTAIAEALRGQ